MPWTDSGFLCLQAGCLRLSMPFRRLVRPFRGCFGAPNSDAEPVSQVNNQVLHSAVCVVHNPESGPPPWHSLQAASSCNFNLELICRNTSLRFQAPRSSNAAPVAVLVPEYEGPILNPFASSQQTDLGGVVFVDCHAAIGSQSAVHASTADIVPSEAGVAPDMSSSDQLDTALTALDNPRAAQPPGLQPSASVNVSPPAPCQPDFCFFDASDSQDYMASLAEALARLCKRASEDGQAQSANQAVTDCQQQHVQEAGATPLSLSAAAAAATGADAAADNPQSPAGPEDNLSTACSVSAGDASETVSDGHMAMADALMSSEVQHAEVDQVVDDLLDEVSAPLQPMQSSLPADNAADTTNDDFSAMMNALGSSEAQHAAVDQVVDELLAEVAAPFQPVQSTMPTDIGGMVSPIVNLLANCVCTPTCRSRPSAGGAAG